MGYEYRHFPSVGGILTIGEGGVVAVKLGRPGRLPIALVPLCRNRLEFQANCALQEAGALKGMP